MSIFDGLIANAMGGNSGGGGGGVLIFTQSADTGYTDKTFKEIEDAFLEGKSVIFSLVSGDTTHHYLITEILSEDGSYYVIGSFGSFFCENENDYMYMPD